MEPSKASADVSTNPLVELAEINIKIVDLKSKIEENDIKYANIERECEIWEDKLCKMRLDVTIAELHKEAMAEKLQEVEKNVTNKQEELQMIFVHLEKKMEAFNEDFSDEIMDTLLKLSPEVDCFTKPDRQKKLDKMERKGRIEALQFYKKIQENYLKELMSDYKNED